MDLRRPWPFALFVLVAHVLARFLGVAAHEFLGHAAFASLLGGSAYAAYVSPGAGFTYVFLPDSVTDAGVVAMQGAGIAVETILGLAVWWGTRRHPSIAWRAFGLVVAVIFVVYSLVYMAAGAFDFFPGDTRSIVLVVGEPLLATGFLVVGSAWTLLVGIFLSLDLIRLFPPGRDLRRPLAMVLVFWLVPAPLSFLPGFAAFGVLEAAPYASIAAFAVVLGVAAGIVLYADLAPGRPPAVARGIRSWAPVAAAAVPLLFLVPAWVGVFGVSPETAHGLLIDPPPPLEAEQAWLGSLAVNLEVFIRRDLSVDLVWRTRGTLVPRSPLEASILSSYDDRMDHVFYQRLALGMSEGALNESVLAGSWFVVTSFVASDESVWSGGTEYPRARVVVVVPSLLNDMSFLAFPGNNTVVVTVHDPFKYDPSGRPSSEGWLDTLVVRWESPLYVVNWEGSGGTVAADLGGVCTPWLGRCVAWQPRNFFDAHDTYRVSLRYA